jgi:hypothetical protein
VILPPTYEVGSRSGCRPEPLRAELAFAYSLAASPLGPDEKWSSERSRDSPGHCPTAEARSSRRIRGPGGLARTAVQPCRCRRWLNAASLYQTRLEGCCRPCTRLDTPLMSLRHYPVPPGEGRHGRALTGLRGPSYSFGGGNRPNRRSILNPMASKRRSLLTGPSSSSPTGKPELVKPTGRLSPGMPALLPGSVLRMYV